MGAAAERIAIVGLGLIGGSLAMALSRSRPRAALIGVDTDPETRSRASQTRIFAEVAGGVAAARGAGLVVVAVPIDSMRTVLKEVAREAPGALVTDTASIKAAVSAWAAEAGVDLVGGHPMCGREQGGFGAADPTLFEGASWVLTRSDPAVDDFVRAVGAHPVVLDPEAHDRLVGGVSHAAFLVAVAYQLALSQSDDWPAMAPIAGGGYRDTTRLAAGDPAMYAAIVRNNPAHASAWLEAVGGVLSRLRQDIASGRDLAPTFERARSLRSGWHPDPAA
jgi:prephenate dehydrogenase